MYLSLEVKNYRCFADTEPLRLPFRRGLTALVGANNSGKSAALKLPYELRDLLSYFQDTSNLLALIRGRGLHFNPSPMLRDDRELFCSSNSRDMEITFRVEEADGKARVPLPDWIKVKLRNGTRQFWCEVCVNGTTIREIAESCDFASTQSKELRFQRREIADFAPFCQLFEELRQSLFISSFRNAINAGEGSYYDMPIGRSFIQEWTRYKSGNRKSDNEAAVSVSDNIGRILGFDRLEILPSEGLDTLQLLIDGKSYKLAEVGSGLSQLIMVLGLAAIRRPPFIMIDEPELNLHPSLQRELLTALAAYTNKGVLMATHSYGLARAAADWVFVVHKAAHSSSTVAPLEGSRSIIEVLGELTFSGYRELGCDKILLVEGPSEVKAVSQLLRYFDKDHEVVCVPLGGRSMICGGRDTELCELLRVSSNISVLLDSERTGQGEQLSASRRAFVATCEKVGIRCHVLERRAIENYFTDDAVRAVFGPSCRAPAHYERLADLSPGWGKQENWRVVHQMSKEDFDDNDLGTFIMSL